jgi:glycosyltransferase involved in cell wall biosynthesis
MEIIVIDDGSTDGTRARVEAHRAEDDRIRIVGQPNRGVAAARNRGIAEAQTELVAPVDSDDLWHPEKIARQLELIDGQPEVGLVCTAYSVLDEEGCITMRYGGSLPPTNQFLDLCRRNFIGNGSSALMRRSAVEQCGGYDESLRRREAQGCEDLKLYLCIAERYRIEFIRSPLTGYRQLSGNMSSNAEQMLRSFDIVAEEFYRRRPDLKPRLNAHRTYMVAWLVHRMIMARRWGTVARLGMELVAKPSSALPTALASAAARRLRRLSPASKGSIGQRAFLTLEP